MFSNKIALLCRVHEVKREILSFLITLQWLNVQTVILRWHCGALSYYFGAVVVDREVSFNHFAYPSFFACCDRII